MIPIMIRMIRKTHILSLLIALVVTVVPMATNAPPAHRILPVGPPRPVVICTPQADQIICTV